MAITNMTGKQYYASKVKEDLKASNTLYDGQVKSTNKEYDTQVFEQGRAYEDQYRENAVQKAINERQVAESMANLGLRDSGLNRTQQTAVQLSYGNNKASIDRQRQAGIDSLNYSRRQALDTIEQSRLAANTQIEQGYAEKAAVYDENRQTEAKNLVLSFLEIGAEPPKDMVALSGMSESEIKGYKKYYEKFAKATATTTKSSSKGSTGSGSTDKQTDYSNLNSQLENFAFNNPDLAAQLIDEYAEKYDISETELMVLLESAQIEFEEYKHYAQKGSIYSDTLYTTQSNDGGRTKGNYKSIGEQKYKIKIVKDTINWGWGVDGNAVVDILYPDGTVLKKGVKLNTLTRETGLAISKIINGNQGKTKEISIDLSDENFD